MAEIALERKAQSLTGWQRKEQLRELRLYRLAKQVVPWKAGEEGYPPRDELEFLANLPVDGDTWATFKNFSNEWAKRRDTERLKKFLPCICEVGEESIVEEFGNDIDSSEDLADRVERKIKDVLASISEGDEEKDESLMKVVSKLTMHATASQERVFENIRSLKGDVSRLQAIVDRQKVLLYVVIGLLVWLLILIVVR